MEAAFTVSWSVARLVSDRGSYSPSYTSLFKGEEAGSAFYAL